MLHKKWIVRIVRVSFLKQDYVVQEGYMSLIFFLICVEFKIWWEYIICIICIFNKSCLEMSIRRFLLLKIIYETKINFKPMNKIFKRDVSYREEK